MRGVFTRQLLPAMWIALSFGCQAATITPAGYLAPDDSSPAEGAEAHFVTEVQPLIDQRCATCHTDAATAPAFIDLADSYTSVMGYPGLVRPGEPSASTLLTKGNHQGPAWTAEQAATIAAWIDAEANNPGAGPGATPRDLESVEITVRDGLNVIPLDDLGMPGSSIQFSATGITQGMRLADVSLVAGTGGAAISSPRFVMYDPSGAETLDDDRFSTTVLRVSSGMTAELTGAMLLVGFPEDGTLSVRFGSASQQSL